VKATNHTYYTTAAQAPSLFAAGFATYTCDDCGDSYTDPLPKTTIQEFLDDNGFFVALAAWVVFLGIRALVRGRKQDDSIC
jgi:hypothetical protein